MVGTENLPLTANLANAEMIDGLGGQYLRGQIYGDRYDRWPDGFPVATSCVIAQVGEQEFVTRSMSRYRVESWKEPRA